VFRPAAWIYGVLLWQLPARNTLGTARVGARIFRRQRPSVSRTVTPPACCARGHGLTVATSCSACEHLRCNLQQTNAGWLPTVSLLAARSSLRAPRRDACRGLTTRPTAAPSSRRLPPLAARRAEMNALVDWLSWSRIPAQIRHWERRRSA